MKNTSNQFLKIQMILMGAFVLLPFIGLFFPGEPSTAPFFVNLLKDGQILMISFVVVPLFSLVSIVASFFNLGQDMQSPLKMSLINQLCSIAWAILSFIIWVQWLAGPYSILNNSDNEVGLGIAIVLVLLATLMVAILAPSLVFVVLPANFHAIMYSLRCFNRGKYESKALPIIGVILLFILPIVGQILLLIYENSLKNTDVIE